MIRHHGPLGLLSTESLKQQAAQLTLAHQRARREVHRMGMCDPMRQLTRHWLRTMAAPTWQTHGSTRLFCTGVIELGRVEELPDGGYAWTFAPQRAVPVTGEFGTPDAAMRAVEQAYQHYSEQWLRD